MVELNTYDVLEKNGILHEWNDEKNNKLGYTPYNVSLHSHKKIWWKCAFNHEWQDTLDHRLLRGDSCPYCSGHRVLTGFNDLSTTCPNFINEWDFEKNNALGFFPEKLSAGSRTKVWWKCSICKNGWQAPIKDRIRGRGCAVCSSRVIISGYNDFASNYPYLMKEWDYSKNNTNFDPNKIAKSSNKSVWWKCQFCGNSWKAIINDRTRGRGCPNCAKRSKTSFPEQTIFYYLKKVFPEAINGYKNNLPQNMELDIFIPSINIAIEYDGPWHKAREKEDTIKYTWCKSHDIILLRISEIDRENPNDCCDRFLLSPFIREADQTIPLFFDQLLKILKKETNILSKIDIEQDRSAILEQYISYIRNNSLAEIYPELVLEWNHDKNGTLTPYMFSGGSNQKVWWKCKVCGYEWNAQINNRTNNHGCPVCANYSRSKRQSEYHRKKKESNLP